MRLILLASATLFLTATVQAQSVDPVSAKRLFSESEIGAIPTPQLNFELNEAIELDFDKYYYFHRPETGFAEAFSDISECDSLSSGISYYSGEAGSYHGSYAAQYGIGGVIGAAIGNALSDAIHGSAARRKVRRINMRNCMGFKGYNRYGLKKDLWSKFNFEEGNGRKDEEVREKALMVQAKVASGQTPITKVLEI